MKEIEITSNIYNPNLRILKNHIVKFNDQFIYLYNMEGNLLDSIKNSLDKEILNIIIINNNYLIGLTDTNLFKIIIKDEHLEIKDIILGKEISNVNNNDKIADILYLAKNKVLIISYKDYIEIRDINYLYEKPIQIINKKRSFLLYMNKELFIAFNDSFISLYQNIMGTKYYQLISNRHFYLNLIYNYRKILKLDNKNNNGSKR